MEEELFDILIPPGVPRTIIAEVLNAFDVELVEREREIYFANMEGDKRELLAFRGTKEQIEKVEEFMFTKLKEFIEAD